VEALVREETTPIMKALMNMIKVQDFKSRDLQHLNMSRMPATAQEDERNMRRLVKFLIFEIHHEENEPYATAKMRDVLLRTPGGQIDFIYQQVVVDPQGETTYPLRIKYGHKKPLGATALAIGYRKLNTNFYSHFVGQELESFYPPREFVTTQNVAIAAARLYDEVTRHPDRWSVKGNDYQPREELVKIFEAKTQQDTGATTNQLAEWAAFLRKHDGLRGQWKSTMRQMDAEDEYISAERQFQMQSQYENQRTLSETQTQCEHQRTPEVARALSEIQKQCATKRRPNLVRALSEIQSQSEMQRIPSLARTLRDANRSSGS
jgi:hypothetical protein